MTISRFGRQILATAALATLATFGTTKSAHATPVLQIKVESGSYVNYALTSQGSGVYTYSSGTNGIASVFTVNVTITTNSPGTSGLAQLIDQTTDVRKNGNGGAHIIAINVIDDYTAPVGSGLTLTSSFAGTAEQTNSHYSLTGSILDAPGTSTLYSNSLNLNGAPAVTTGVNLASAYKLGSVIALNLTPNETAIVTGTTKVTGPGISAVPEPGAIALVVTGLGSLGFVGLRRRGRKATV